MWSVVFIQEDFEIKRPIFIEGSAFVEWKGSRSVWVI